MITSVGISRGRRAALMLCAVGSIFLATNSFADERHRSRHELRERQHHVQRQSYAHRDTHKHERERAHARADRHWQDHDRNLRRSEKHRRHTHRHERKDWHFYSGRHWAPPSYRGRYCSDRHHYHGVHYHVAARDYYDYYYPRFRHHGPIGAASFIITVPLF
jgi:hypothetical protein